MLVGMMGAGKTSVGRVCARRLGREFWDTDQLVESRVEATVAEIFESEGEEWFRGQEREALDDLCASTEALVIACGGGVVLDPANRESLRDAGCVAWLQADPKVLGERVRGASTRPLLASGGTTTATETLERIAADRAALYDEVADVRVDTEGRSIDEVADAVLEAYAS